MSKSKPDITIEHEYVPTPDAAARLEAAWDIIVELILEDYLAELSTRVDELGRLHTPSGHLAESQRELDALLPSVLDKAFKGKL